MSSGRVFEKIQNLEVDTLKVKGASEFADTAHAGQVAGAGTSSLPVQLGTTTDKNALSYYFSSYAASGTSRGMYLRLYLNGGAGGEAARIFTTVADDTPADTVNGAHTSLNFGSSAGNVTGLGTAQRCTLHIPNRSLGGTTAAVQAELYSDGASSDLGGTTSFVRFVNDGNATGKGKVDASGFFFDISGLTAGATKMFSTGITAATINAATTASLKCKVGGTTYYIPLATAIV